jgi:ubiquinone biosynthesis protein
MFNLVTASAFKFCVSGIVSKIFIKPGYKKWHMPHIRDYIKDMSRLDNILQVFYDEGFSEVIDGIKLTHRIKKNGVKDHAPPHIRMRKAFEKLGPTFVRFGQMLASRSDLVPKRYAQEFEKIGLQPALFPDIKKLIETELGTSISRKFRGIDEKPISVGTTVQFHKGVLLSGQAVLIKVERHRMKEHMEHDIEIMFCLAHMIDKQKLIKYHMLGLVKEFHDLSRKELDFSIAAQNMGQVRGNLQHLDVHIPKLYHDYSTQRMLIIEFESGEHLKEHHFRTPEEQKALVSLLAKVICKMVFEDGLFLAEPSDANIFVTNQGKLIMPDFSVVGNLPENLRNNTCGLFKAMLDKDTELAIDLLLNMASSRPNANLRGYRENALVLMQTGTNSMAMTLYHVICEGGRRGILFPPDLVKVVWSLICFERLSLSIYPKADSNQLLKPYLKRMVIVADKPKNGLLSKQSCSNIPKNVAELLHRIDMGDLKFHMDKDELRDFEKSIKASTDKEALAIIIAALLVTSPLLYYLKIHVFSLNLGILSVVLAFALLIRLLIVMTKKLGA